MIRSILRLKDFGIFKSCTNSGLQDFGRFNLVYGWNGSGKSTLCALFESVEKEIPPDPKKYPLAEFQITCSDGTCVAHDNLTQAGISVRTFNQTFVKDNIDWSTSVKSILLISKERVADHKALEALQQKEQDLIAECQKEERDIGGLEAKISDFLTKSAKRTKTSLQVIDTRDSRYLNYNRTKLEEFIIANKDEINGPSSTLEDSQIVELTAAAKPDKKSAITHSIAPIEADRFFRARERLNQLLQTSVVSKTIERLTKNPDIQSWVSEGFDIYKKHGNGTCDFCGNAISDQRIKEIEGHFSDDFVTFKETLQKAELWLENQRVANNDLPAESAFYKELQADYLKAVGLLKEASDAISTELSKWQAVLKQKIENPFNTSLDAHEISASLLQDYGRAAAVVADVIKAHNNKTDNFESETAKSKKRLELHYAAVDVKDFDYFGKKSAVEARRKANEMRRESIARMKPELSRLQTLLTNETIGALEFNRLLHKFLGRTDLGLRFSKELMGYEIIRNDVGNHDGNLSEGEKTAIGFVYFITKLREKNNRIEDTVVVVDDPVSSFDSNHLFHAYSFLRNSCKDAKQLFVLTHNFTFFRMVRDWFVGMNRNRQKEKKPPNSCFYAIEASNEVPRAASLVNADDSLVDYNSEYHYLFSRLYQYRERQSLSRDEAFLTANLCRKLLEAFFSFKFPKHRGDFASLLVRGLKGCSVTDEGTRERIYRFVNRYSHSDVIDINEDSSENLVGESVNVVGDILKWIEEVDEVHYQEMKEVVA